MNRLIVFFLSLLLLFTSGQTQIPKALGKVKLPPRLEMPDLVIRQFQVPESSRQITPERDYKYTFTANVANQGNKAISGPFFLTVQVYKWTQQRWESSALSVGSNCIRVNTPLQAGESRALVGSISLRNYEVETPQVKLRLVVDCSCNREIPPSRNFDILELHEDNNASNELILTGGYAPNIAEVSPSKKVLKAPAEITLGGTGFGSTQEAHTVLIRFGATKVEAQIKHWSAGYIKCTLPADLPAGSYHISIADTGTLLSRSNVIHIEVVDQKLLPWVEVTDTWKLLQDAFSLKLNTWNGHDYKYENTSTLTILGTRPVEVKNIQFHQANLGDYRYLISHLETREGGLQLTRGGCQPNQFRLIASFENHGRELHGYFKALGPLAGYTDVGAPNVEVNNAQMSILFNLTANGPHLDYSVSPYLTADIKAAPGSNWILDLFMPDWRSMIEDRVGAEVKKSLEDPAQKGPILADLTRLFGLLSGAPMNRVDSLEFTPQGILITWD